MEAPPPETRRRAQPPGNPWLWLAGALVLVLVAVLVAVAVAAGDEDEEAAPADLVTVPEVVGLDEAEAVAVLEDEGLDADREVVTDESPAGTVLGQEPEAGAEVDAGSEVLLRIAGATTETDTVVVTETEAVETEPAEGEPPPTVVVPDVVGLDHVEAGQAVEDDGLIPDSFPVESNEPRGTVIAQEPDPGREVANTRHVRLSVSVGGGDRQLERVPDVTGPKAPEARAIARQSGFTVRTADRDAPTAEEVGEVILQRPKAGSDQPVLTQITLFVGR